MPDNLRLGAWNALAAAVAFALAGACVKAAAETAPLTLMVFFRNATGLLLLLPWLLRRGGRALLATRRWPGHFGRAAFGVSAMYCLFYALARLHLSEAMLLTYSAPLFIPLLAWWALRERPPLILAPALGLGLGGVYLIARPDAGALLAPAAVVGLLSGAFAAAAMVTIRRISDTEPAVRIVFYFTLLSTVLTALPLAWTWQAPGDALGWMLATGVLATAGQFFLTRAYSLAPAARVGAVTYASVVFAGLLGWLVWGETPDAQSMAGMVLVIGCCLLAARQAPLRPRRPSAG